MRNKRLIIALLAAITFGLIAAVSVKQYLLSAQAFSRTNEVVVAKVAIPEGYRAMTVKVDDVVGVSGFIMPGTLVDIVVVIQPPKGTANEEMISKIVLQNIKVLASGQNIDKPKN